MPKFNRILSTSLVTALMISSLSTRVTQTARAQTNPSKPWENIFKNFFEKTDNDPPVPPASGGGSSRSPVVCAIAPQPITTNTVVWSDRPLLVWRGMLSRIEIHPTGSNQVLWRQTGLEGHSRALYAGEALQPGQTYDWLIFNPFAMEDSPPSQRVTFRVMDAQERDRTKIQLQKLEAEFKDKGASAEQIAIHRAEYFAQKNLWSDVLQEAYSVKNPSAALAEIIHNLPTEICRKSSKPNSLPSQ